MSIPTPNDSQCTEQTRSRVEFELPSRAFVLNTTLSNLDTNTIELTTVTEDDGDVAGPVLWVRGGDDTEITTTFFTEPDLDAWTLLSARGEDKVYQPVWSERARKQFHVLLNNDEGTGTGTGAGATLQSATASGTQWTLELTVPTREAVQDLYDRCSAHGLPIAITHLSEHADVERC